MDRLSMEVASGWVGRRMALSDRRSARNLFNSDALSFYRSGAGVSGERHQPWIGSEVGLR
jgi:hypothetical protein